MIERLEDILKRYQEIHRLLMDPEINSDMRKLRELSKEQSALEPIVTLYTEYKEVVSSIRDLKELTHETDPEMVELAKMELEELKPRVHEIEDELKIL